MLRRAMAAVAAIMGCAALALLITFAAVDHETLDSGLLSRVPACSARLAGGSCSLCGMSHSLVAMSRGDWDEAARWNAGGPWLYGALIVQAALGMALLPLARPEAAGQALRTPPDPATATVRDSAG